MHLFLKKVIFQAAESSFLQKKFGGNICFLNTRFYEKNIPFIVFQKLSVPVFGQVDSPESPETPEITEIIENLMKVTKDFTKLKDTLTNYVREKSHFKKQ